MKYFILMLAVLLSTTILFSEEKEIQKYVGTWIVINDSEAEFFAKGDKIEIEVFKNSLFFKRKYGKTYI